MKYRIIGSLILFLFTVTTFSQEKTEYKVHTLAFYNVENLFDIENDPNTYDDDRTPDGKDLWTIEKYRDKIKNMARVISLIGKDVTHAPPVIIGLAEIENKKVLDDLVNDPSLIAYDYGVIHYDSPDPRGIDVALLYQKRLFRVKKSVSQRVLLYDIESKNRVFTRDQLLVSGYLDKDLIHVIVNHWPSRRGGQKRSDYKRRKAAMQNKQSIDSIFSIDPYSKIITMGDFNDNPNNKSIFSILKAKRDKEKVRIKELYNPMYAMKNKGMGTLAWRDDWSFFDQIIISSGLLQNNYESFQFYKAKVFNPRFLSVQRGKYKGYPFRSYVSGSYTGGYSDHYPIYMYLIKH